MRFGEAMTVVESKASANVRLSRIGKRPIRLATGVSVSLGGGMLEVKGPKGTLKRVAPPNVSVKVAQGSVAVEPVVSGRDGARYQGLAWALIGGMVEGVTTGYVRTLQLVGTGYRAEVKGAVLNLSLGFSHPVVYPLPQGVKAEVPADSKGTMVVLSGADKGVITQAAAKIRSFRAPEPYGGKGVRYHGEKVREKAGKAGKGGK